MNFLITGHGRCGTQLLSTWMNSSKKWTVLHEPRGGGDDAVFRKRELNVSLEKEILELKTPGKIINEFEKEYYGEVNSVMKYYFFTLPVNKRGMIYRDYVSVITSFSNRPNWTNILDQKILNVNFFHNLFYKFLMETPDVYLIDFEKMTSSVEYANKIINVFDIEDVEITKEDLVKKMNTNSNNRFKKIYDLPEEYVNLINNLKWSDYNNIKRNRIENR